MEEKIPLEELEPRGVYRIHSRNLSYGVWKPSTGGFIGIREKFGERYLFQEYYADGRAFGTATPFQIVNWVPEYIELDEDMGTVCSNCGKKAWWTGPPGPAPWACESDCEDVHAHGTANTVLFDLLDEIEKGEE